MEEQTRVQPMGCSCGGCAATSEAAVPVDESKPKSRWAVMVERITPLQLIVVNATAIGLAVAAHFGFRCPAPGCPACKWIGQ